MLDGANKVLGFVLEVAMIAAFAVWGFRLVVPWQFIVGLGLPLVVVVLWGIFMAPRSERRLAPVLVRRISVLLFLAASVALMASGLSALGVTMAVFALAHGAMAEYFARRATVPVDAKQQTF